MVVTDHLSRVVEGAIRPAFRGIRPQTAEEVKDLGFFCLLYGPGGGGKTRTAGKLGLSQYGQVAYHGDVEGGATSLTDLIDSGHVISDGLKTWREVKEAQRQLEASKFEGIQTVIWDNLSELQMLCLKGITTGKPEIQHWGECTSNMLTFLREWRDIARFQKINVVMVCWDETEKDELDGKIKKRVQFTPSLAGKVPGILTMVGHLTVMRDGLTRQLDFAPSEKTDSKFRIAPNGPASSIPLKLYFKDDGNPLHDMLATIRDGKAFPVTKYAQPKGAVM